MKRQADSIQYTVRGIPPEVDRSFRQKAARTKRSFNQVIVEEVTMASIGKNRKVDFSDIVGLWTPDPGFDEIIAAQRRIDRTKWK